jgi:hypothetical protein
MYGKYKPVYRLNSMSVGLKDIIYVYNQCIAEGNSLRLLV